MMYRPDDDDEDGAVVARRRRLAVVVARRRKRDNTWGGEADMTTKNEALYGSIARKENKKVVTELYFGLENNFVVQSPPKL